MSEEKCFCHFGGYAVKDATARHTLSNNATIAALGAAIAETTGEDGFGSCIVMHDADNCIIFDFGNDEGATLDKYLREKGIRKIDAIYISHFHSDHFQLVTLENLIANYTVNNVVFPHAAVDWSKVHQLNIHHKNTYTEAKNVVEAAGINCVEPTEEGETAAYGEFSVSCHNVSPEMLGEYYEWKYDSYYTETECENYNSFSMVNCVSFRGHKIVVTGDITEKAQENVYDVLSCAELITVPHHGLDLMIAHNLINRLSAKHAVIQSAYDKNGYLTKTSHAFAGELIKNGCRVTTTHSPGNATNAVYCIGMGGIEPIKLGVMAGRNISPCILEPGSDLDALEDGEFITYSDAHAKSILNAPLFHAYRGIKFVVSTKTSGQGTQNKERYQTVRTVDTSVTPQICNRNMVSENWNPWHVSNPALNAGTEFLTDEMWNGKKVWKKLVEFVNAEAIAGTGSVYVPHGIPDLEWMISVTGTTQGYFVPYFTSETSLVPFAWNGTNIVLQNNGSAWDPGRTWYFTVKYTKQS